jgi:hypothetical protein
MHRRWLGPGLFFATLATLLLEILDARLLSVLTWYHLSFFAVSVAMLGMAGGAVYVFLRPARFSPDAAPRSLATATFAFACAIPISHLMNLTMPFLPLNEASVMEILSIAVFTVVLAVPFMLSGVVVTTALTRCGGRISRLYAWDLVGAALGCMLVVPILEYTNVTSAVFVAGAAAAVAAWCFARMAGVGLTRRSGIVAALLVAAAALNTGGLEVLSVIYPKNRALWLTNSANAFTRWNSHSHVLVHRPGESQAFLWGPGEGAEQFHTTLAWMVIDGEAGTPVTRWDGDPESLEWVSYDVTTLPYFLRHGDVAVIGVGGGRDILAALWGRNRSIVGIDVNRIMLDLLSGSHQQFANITTQPQVTLVHDDARSYLTRAEGRFDVIQMSLVDTWASTGAGAFTLSENGLYTLEAWRVFLDRLTPGGVLSVSRWFDPDNVSETSRLLSLGVAALIDRRVPSPRDHLLLVARERVATLIVSTAPFTPTDRETLQRVASDRGFDIILSPWAEPAGVSLLGRISDSRSTDELRQATADPIYDYTPPTDARPYYFNMLKPQAYFNDSDVPRTGALGGNLRATLLLLVLLGVATVLVSLIIIWPLVRSGRPAMPAGRFFWTMAYFATIGFAYMLIQIGLLQRFSTYLGHPTYTLAIVLFSMLLFTGVGSLLSDRLFPPGARIRMLPLLIASALVLTALSLPAVIQMSVSAGLPIRTLWVLAFTGSMATLLGMCFPIGVRLMGDQPAVVAWAWGVNGACGVLASILAVGLSLWVGIDVNFWVAAFLYAGLTLPLTWMKAQAAPEMVR